MITVTLQDIHITAQGPHFLSIDARDQSREPARILLSRANAVALVAQLSQALEGPADAVDPGHLRASD